MLSKRNNEFISVISQQCGREILNLRAHFLVSISIYEQTGVMLIKYYSEEVHRRRVIHTKRQFDIKNPHNTK